MIGGPLLTRIAIQKLGLRNIAPIAVFFLGANHQLHAARDLFKKRPQHSCEEVAGVAIPMRQMGGIRRVI